MDDYGDVKLESLSQNGTLNTHPEDVTDDLVTSQ